MSGIPTVMRAQPGGSVASWAVAFGALDPACAGIRSRLDQPATHPVQSRLRGDTWNASRANSSGVVQSRLRGDTALVCGGPGFALTYPGGGRGPVGVQ